MYKEAPEGRCCAGGDANLPSSDEIMFATTEGGEPKLASSSSGSCPSELTQAPPTATNIKNPFIRSSAPAAAPVEQQQIDEGVVKKPNPNSDDRVVIPRTRVHLPSSPDHRTNKRDEFMKMNAAGLESPRWPAASSPDAVAASSSFFIQNGAPSSSTSPSSTSTSAASVSKNPFSRGEAPPPAFTAARSAFAAPGGGSTVGSKRTAATRVSIGAAEVASVHPEGEALEPAPIVGQNKEVQDQKPQTPVGRKKAPRALNQFDFMRKSELDLQTRPADWKQQKLKNLIPLSEVAKHNKRHDCWMVLGGNVYDVTSYLAYHPGGKGELLRGAGKDATDLYNEVHAWVSYDAILKSVLIGRLAPRSLDLGQGPPVVKTNLLAPPGMMGLGGGVAGGGSSFPSSSPSPGAVVRRRPEPDA